MDKTQHVVALALRRRRLDEAAATHAHARAELHHAITQAFTAGLTKSEIARACGYSRERVAQVLKQHGESVQRVIRAFTSEEA